jgi:hypothetical protein
MDYDIDDKYVKREMLIAQRASVVFGIVFIIGAILHYWG